MADREKKLNISITKRTMQMKEETFFVATEGVSFGEKIKSNGSKL